MQVPPHLIFVSDDHPGYSRKRWGRGFTYYDIKRQRIKNAGVLKRIKSLVIPPIWDQVWICPEENGHLQSTGIDTKKRKQYLYHSDWTAYRQQTKFAKLYHFGTSLPSIRKAYEQDLRQRGWPKTKVIGLIVYLLDNYYFRIGNLYYTRKNQSYGITTLRRKHLQREAESLNITYTAKSGKQRKVKINNRRIAKLIREISELPGYEIFRYLDESGNSCKIDSSDVNQYLQDINRFDYTAKDFRTWGASKLTLEYYEDVKKELDENPRLKFETTITKKVAKVMGNTVTVCRKYYIHPKILGQLIEHYPEPLSELIISSTPQFNLLDKYENLLLKLLEKAK